MSIIKDTFFGGAEKDAARQQRKAAEQGIALQRETRDIVRGDLQPFREFGAGQLDQLQALLSPQGQADYLTSNPLFANALDSVNRATMNSQAARGRLGAGDTLEALQSNYLTTALPFLQNQQSNLFNAVGMGQNASAMQGQASMQGANNITDLLTQIGNAQAAGTIGRANAIKGGIGDIASLIGAFSDRRLKRNINRVGSYKGHNVYSFEYVWGGKAIGVMADEMPESIVMDRGFMMVNYGEL